MSSSRGVIVLADYRLAATNCGPVTPPVAKPTGRLRDSTRAETIENAAIIIIGGAFSIVGWYCVGAVIWQLAASLWQ
jgi:hypothetical protein